MTSTLLSSAQQDFSENSRERILSEDYVSLIYHSETYPFQIEQLRSEFLPQPVDWQYAILNAPLSQYPPDISTQGYFTIPKLFTLMDMTALDASGILSVQNQPFLNLTGRRVLLGFIDTGIDYRHPAFRNPDGSSRVLFIWDQADRSGRLPEGFLYGSEYTKTDIDTALRSLDPLSVVPSIDENGHGTAMAGIAAGTPDETTSFSGAAPESNLAVVKLKPAKQYLRNYFLADQNAIVFQEDDCMLAIRYLMNKARKTDLPLIICFGLGTNQGGHDGHTPLDEVMAYLSYTSGRYGVVAAGNEVRMGHHCSGAVAAEGLSQEVEVVAEQAGKGFCLELWAYAPELFAVGVTTPLGERLSPADPRLHAKSGTTFLLDGSSVQIDYEIVEFRSGSQLIQIRVQDPSPGIWRFQIVNKRFLNGSFHIWLPATGICPPGVRFLSPDPDTTLTVPSCNNEIVTVSTCRAYSNAIYENSGRGFTRNGNIKPDIAAVGVDIQAPCCLNTYRSFTGSSAAAALTAGAMALLVQWGIESSYNRVFSSTEIKNLLYRGANRISGLYYPNREWGYGSLDIYGVFQSLSGF